MNLLLRAAAARRKLCHVLAGNRASLNRFECWQCSYNVDSVGTALQDFLLRTKEAQLYSESALLSKSLFTLFPTFPTAFLDNGKNLLDLSEVPASQGSFLQSRFF